MYIKIKTTAVDRAINVLKRLLQHLALENLHIQILKNNLK